MVSFPQQHLTMSFHLNLIFLGIFSISASRPGIFIGSVRTTAASVLIFYFTASPICISFLCSAILFSPDYFIVKRYLTNNLFSGRMPFGNTTNKFERAIGIIPFAPFDSSVLVMLFTYPPLGFPQRLVGQKYNGFNMLPAVPQKTPPASVLYNCRLPSVVVQINSFVPSPTLA